MISKSSTGVTLPASFLNRMAASYLDETLAPNDIILFCRKVGGTWYTRDVSYLWEGQDDIVRRVAEQYGVSQGGQADFVFRNQPVSVLSTNYTSGVTINVEGRTTKINGTVIDFEPAINDWIAISSYDFTEYRRIIGVARSGEVITGFTISEALDNTYPASETQVRYCFAIHPTKNRLDPDDFFSGVLKIKTGFPDLAGDFGDANPYITNYQGKIIASGISTDDHLVLTCQDILQDLVDYEITDTVEFDDRGVASVPTESGWNGEGTPNKGNGTCSDVSYNEGKLPDLLITETVTLTYQAATIGFEASGTVSGIFDSGEPSTTDFLSTGEIGQRRWLIDRLQFDGWSVTISEGDIRFEAGDSFKFFIRESGYPIAAKGKGFTTSPLDIINLTGLQPSKIIAYVLNYLFARTHENPETGATSNLLDSTLLAAVQGIPQDAMMEIRGRFRARSRVIEIIDDALKLNGGWVFTLEDNHLGIYCYSPFMLKSPTGFTLSYDPDNTARVRNVLGIQFEPRRLDTVRNKVVFRYNTDDREKEVTRQDTTNVSIYGSRQLMIRAEDFKDYELSSRFDGKAAFIRNLCDQILLRYKNPIERLSLIVHPNALLSELADTPFLYARDIQYAERLWITEISKNIKARHITIRAERAYHIQGKFAIFQDTPPETASTIWNSTGFIGSEGEERLGYFGDDSDPSGVELDGLGDNDSIFEPRLGAPDPWGNYVEENFIFG